MCPTFMAFSEFEKKRAERIIGHFIEKRRPPPHIRPKLDLGFRVSGQSIEIFEIRPAWRNPTVRREHSVAKATYVKTQGIWRVFWQRANLKWYRYDPVPEVESLEQFVSLVAEDEYACFFG